MRIFDAKFELRCYQSRNIKYFGFFSICKNLTELRLFWFHFALTSFSNEFFTYDLFGSMTAKRPSKFNQIDILPQDHNMSLKAITIFFFDLEQIYFANIFCSVWNIFCSCFQANHNKASFRSFEQSSRSKSHKYNIKSFISCHWLEGKIY